LSYTVATDIRQALKLLQQAGGKARVVAGATDLFLEGLPDNLIDISRLPEMALIEEKEGFLEIGAALTHARTAASELLRLKATALAEASAAVGSPQVRNVATLGGNVANAAPAADAAVALVALGALATLVFSDGQSSETSVEQLYAGYNRSTIDSSKQILFSFRVRACGDGEGSAFVRFAPRKALSLPILNAAASVKMNGYYIDELRLVVAPAGPAPTRLYDTEEKLRGAALSDQIWAQIETAASAEVEVRDSLVRCSARYRKQLVGVMTVRALRIAVERALAGKDLINHD
jgi:CO/xanthine dehydrogenase FAD-binding subunit